MLEKKDTIGTHVTIDSLTNNFALIKNQTDLNKMAKEFKEPVLCHYYAVVNKAIEYSSLFS
jgi:hypothetical protein